MGEAELIKQCMRGVNAARKELYDTYAEQMLSICFRYTGGMDVAYDLLHDGFLKVFSSCSSFSYRGEGSLKAWMSRIFVNTALEYLRKKDVLKQVVPLDIIAETEEGYSFSYDKDYLEREDAAAVSLTLPLREEPYETTILFPFFDGLIPEGWLLGIVSRNWKINQKDRFGLLLLACKDCIGDVCIRGEKI